MKYEKIADRKGKRMDKEQSIAFVVNKKQNKNRNDQGAESWQ